MNFLLFLLICNLVVVLVFLYFVVWSFFIGLEVMSSGGMSGNVSCGVEVMLVLCFFGNVGSCGLVFLSYFGSWSFLVVKGDFCFFVFWFFSKCGL